MSKAWLPLESNPELMNSYLERLGARSSLRFVDVFGIDEDLLAMVPQPVFAVLMLFPISDKSEEHRKQEKIAENVSSNVWFTRQKVANACGTVGLLHAVFNNKDVISFEPNSFFDNFSNATKNVSAEERAVALDTNNEIENKHMEVASAGQSHIPAVVNLHFNTFVHVDGVLYELDGRKEAPIQHGHTTPSTLLVDAVNVAKQFMARDPDNVNFNLVALAKESAD